MRHIVLLGILLLTLTCPVAAADSVKDSLQTALVRAQNPEEKMRLYRDLADVTYDTPEESGYLSRLFEQARVKKDTNQMLGALTDLSIAYIMADKLDSVRHYISIAGNISPVEERERWVCYLRMRLFGSELLREEAGKAVEDKIAGLKSREMAKESIYAQIEVEYALGTALFYENRNQEALPYLKKALTLSKQLPFREGCCYQLLVLRQLSRVYSTLKQPENAVAVTKNSIELKEKYYNLYEKPLRPYYPMDDFYITQYAALMMNSPVLTKEERVDYFNRVLELNQKTDSPYQKYSCLLTLANYYATEGDFRNSLIYNDSMICYSRQIAPNNLPGIYRVCSRLHELLGEPQEALACLRESYRLQDSIRQSDMQEQLNQMRVEHDVNRLNYENSRLEIRNKHIMVVSLAVVLVLAVSACVYLYIHLKQEQVRRRQMRVLKLQAEESEKLKTAFIHSICHEIRTPLNAVVGYAGLLLDPSIDAEDKESFPEEIKRGTAQLLLLIDSMLEVSSLDVSDEKLPCEPVDVSGLCCQVGESLAQQCGIEQVKSETDLPGEPLVVCTNGRYLTLVIENLLGNAYKFTKEGHVTLSCRRIGNEVMIAVTDTGCGIPSEKREVVFGRFTKLDAHTQGSGLGLYLCRLIVHRLSGRIFVDPNYSGGTRVVVVLPFK